MQKIKTSLFEIQNGCFRFLIKKSFRTIHDINMTYVGNNYSGYWIPNGILSQKGTIWGVGLGRDSSFELELTRLGFKFYGFEPEPECFEVSVEQFRNTNATIEKYGLWDKNGYFPYTGDNFSIVDIFNLKTISNSKLQIRSLWKVANEKGLQDQPSPRILKMNIEGAEREILLRFLQEPLDFDLIIFQAEFLFHLGFKRIVKKISAYKDLRKILKGLYALGWRSLGISRHQITLINTRIS